MSPTTMGATSACWRAGAHTKMVSRLLGNRAGSKFGEPAWASAAGDR